MRIYIILSFLGSAVLIVISLFMLGNNNEAGIPIGTGGILLLIGFFLMLFKQDEPQPM